MRKSGMMLSLAAVLLWVGTGLAAGEQISGQITKMEGEKLTVQTQDGKTKTIHVDPATTEKEGDLRVGAQIVAEMGKGDHATSIKVDEAAGSPSAPGAGQDGLPGGSSPQGGGTPGGM